MKAPQETRPDSLKAYLQGFILSLLLTFASYFLVVHHLLSGFTLIIGIMTLGLLQALVQLIFFLHLGKEKGSDWNLLSFLFMISIVVILVAGSLWIMAELSYNLMPNM